MIKIEKGLIVIVDFGKVNGEKDSVQRGYRTCVVVSNDRACKFSPVLTIVPLTTKTKRTLGTHAYIEKDDMNNLDHDSVIMCEQIFTVNREQIWKVVGKLDDKFIKRLNYSLGVSLGL